MALKQLKSPPLVEVILEVKWSVGAQSQTSQAFTPPISSPGIPSELAVDPSYDVLIGRLFDRLSKEYPFHERLPSAAVPPYMVPFLVQHRFRKGENLWPLVQVGAGIATLNDTERYMWSDFSGRAVALVETLFNVHPKSSELKVESLLLRYIDAEPIDYASDTALEFLRQKLKVNFALPDSLLKAEQVEDRPEDVRVNFQIMYPISRPKGTAQLRFTTGTRHDQRAIIWETAVTSVGPDVPKLPQGAKDWLEAAHALVHDWFFKLIEGELLSKYSKNE